VAEELDDATSWLAMAMQTAGWRVMKETGKFD
jgi:hypothetical protein